jgi:hypothetical protein
MKPSKIALFAIALFVLHVAAGALTTLSVGVEDIEVLTVIQFVTGVVISVCVFGYMSWAHPTKPYLTALMVGVLSMLFGVLSSTVLFGNMSWLVPVLLVADILAMLLSVILGVSLGLMLRRRGSTSLQ